MILISQWLHKHDKKRTELSLKLKVELLQNSDGKSSRLLAEKYYGVGRTQVQNLMKRKRQILDSYRTMQSFLSPNCFACGCQ